jgi:hypothetical protein
VGRGGYARGGARVTFQGRRGGFAYPPQNVFEAGFGICGEPPFPGDVVLGIDYGERGGGSADIDAQRITRRHELTLTRGAALETRFVDQFDDARRLPLDAFLFAFPLLEVPEVIFGYVQSGQYRDLLRGDEVIVLRYFPHFVVYELCYPADFVGVAVARNRIFDAEDGHRCGLFALSHIDPR